MTYFQLLLLLVMIGDSLPFELPSRLAPAIPFQSGFEVVSESPFGGNESDKFGAPKSSMAFFYKDYAYVTELFGYTQEQAGYT